MTEDVGRRIDRLIGELTAAGHLRGDDIRAALRTVPRHLFLPAVAWACPTGRPGCRIDREADPRAWWDAAYSDIPIITQIDDGAGEVGTGDGDFTSSASAPSTVTSLLELLEAERGHRVLEIGTGTGWTAALTSHLVGEQHVTSVEVDEQVAKQAAINLEIAGYTPHLIVGDGATLASNDGPFDRVHATCAVSRVPYGWVAQTRPGGVVVTPYAPGFGYGHELRLVVMPDGTALGRFPGYANYMLMRSQRPAHHGLSGEADVHHSRTRIDPRTIAYAPAGADLAMSAMMPGVYTRTRNDGDRFTLWLVEIAAPDGSWASVNYEPGANEYEVQQVGDRRLWQEAEAAYFRWVSWHEPDRARFGMTVTPESRQVWLDDPSRVLQSERQE